MKTEIAFWQHHPINDQKGETLAVETINFQKKFNFDRVKITPAGSWLATCYGVEDAWENDFLGRRTILKRIIRTPEDWLNVAKFKQQPPLLKEIISAAEITCGAINDRPVYATVFNPVSQAIQLSGLEVFKSHWKSHPEEVTKALATITENTLWVFDLFKKAGISGMYFVTQFMRSEGLTLDEYEYAGKYFDTLCLQHASELFEDTIFHIHGENIYISVPENIPGIRIHYGMSRSETTDNIRQMEKLTNYPLIHGIAVQQLSDVANVAEAKAILDLFYDTVGKRWDIITSDCVLPLNFPSEKIAVWKEASEN